MNNFPAHLTRFVGRSAEIGELVSVVTNYRLVTLVGAGAIGKTRLAIEVAVRMAAAFVDGMCYVDLAPITEPRVVPATVGHSFGIPDQPGRSTSETLCRFLGDRQILLLLDNCEHLLDPCSALIGALLTACPHVTVLTTSREPIGVDGELTWMVPPLSLSDDAIELFSDRACRARPDFRATADDSVIIADICRRLDGMPLAIELAAARVRALSLTHILENLDDRFQLLTGGARTALQRHQTLRASVDWSYALLTEPERKLFCRLGVFFGGFDLEAAQAVGAATPVEHHHVIDHLSQLVDKSLLVAENASGAMRYRLLETMRQYAVEKLAASDDADAVRDRHRDHYTDRATNLASSIEDGYQRLLAWADAELDNLRAAYARSRDNGDVEKALRLASSLQPFWTARARLREGLAWFDEAVTDAPGPDVAPEIWARAVVHENTLAGWFGTPLSPYRVQAALSIARTVDDPTLIASTLNVCGMTTVYDAEKCATYLQEAAELARASNDRRTLCETRLYQAILGGMVGDPMRASAAAEESRDLASALGDRYMSWSSQIWLSHALYVQGELHEAAQVLMPLVEARATTGQLFMSFFANVFLGRVRAYQGQPGPARACWEAARATATAMGGFQEDTSYAMLAEAALAAGDGPGAKQACEAGWRHCEQECAERAIFNRVLNPMPEALLACGEPVVARRWADDAVALVRGCNKAVALVARAHIALAQGESEQAERDAHDAVVIAGHTHGFLRLPDAVECLARLASGHGAHQNAAHLFGAAAAIRDDKGMVRFPVYQASYDTAVESSRDALGARAFDSAWAEGATLSIEETIAYSQRGHGKRKRPSCGWESLTPTEIDVVRLVRDGLANKDIAVRLLISRRTVQTHLTHVYTKLGLTSRVQLVHEATRHT